MKTHLNLATTDLAKSVQFYSTLLDAKPAKMLSDYALFITEQPGLELALYLRSSISPTSDAHYGICVDSIGLVYRTPRDVLLREPNQDLGHRSSRQALGNLHGARGYRGAGCCRYYVLHRCRGRKPLLLLTRAAQAGIDGGDRFTARAHRRVQGVLRRRDASERFGDACVGVDAAVDDVVRIAAGRAQDRGGSLVVENDRRPAALCAIRE